MARKCLIEKEKKRKRLTDLKWNKRQELKKRVIDMDLSEEEREKARNDLANLPRNSAPTRMRSRCALTGRSRGFLRKFGLSRLCFREKALNGEIPGVTKSSW